jgi:hypothetical protein
MCERRKAGANRQGDERHVQKAQNERRVGKGEDKESK